MSKTTFVTRKELQEELRAIKASLLEASRASEERIMRYFDVKVEQLTHDFRGIFNDRTEQLKDRHLDHEQRLQRIERQLQLV